jgi:hypothetical protein
VLYNEAPHKQQPEAFQAWMKGMLAKYDLRRVERFPVSSLEKKFGQTWDSLYWIYEFVPRGSSSDPTQVGALAPLFIRR